MDNFYYDALIVILIIALVVRIATYLFPKEQLKKKPIILFIRDISMLFFYPLLTICLSVVVIRFYMEGKLIWDTALFLALTLYFLYESVKIIKQFRKRKERS